MAGNYQDKLDYWELESTAEFSSVSSINHETIATRDASISLRIERDRLRRQLAVERAKASQAARQHDARLAELHGVIAELLRRRDDANKGIPEEDDISEVCDSTTHPAADAENDADRSKTDQNDSSSLLSPCEPVLTGEETKQTTETSDYIGRSDSLRTEEPQSENQCLDSGQGLDIKDLEYECGCKLKELRISENSLLTADSLDRIGLETSNFDMSKTDVSCQKCASEMKMGAVSCEKSLNLSDDLKNCRRKVSRVTDDSIQLSDKGCQSCQKIDTSCDVRSCVTSDLLNSEERLDSEADSLDILDASHRKHKSSSVGNSGRYSPVYGFGAGQGLRCYAENTSPVEARVASRVRLRKVSEGRSSDQCENKYAGMSVEKMVGEIKTISDYEEALNISNSQAAASLAVALAKCEKLEADVELLQASLAHAKDNSDRLFLENARHESASVELCRALRAADRALETYDVLLALAEAKEKELPVAQSVAMMLLKRLDKELDGYASNIGEPLMPLGPWRDHYGVQDTVTKWSCDDERRLREHAARLKAECANVRRPPPDLFCYCSSDDENSATSSKHMKTMDIEAAVIKQEQASLKFEKAKSLQRKQLE